MFSDLDECQTGNENCHYAAECTNTLGSFNCTCWSGFEGDGVVCAGVIKGRKAPTENAHIYTIYIYLIFVHLASGIRVLRLIRNDCTIIHTALYKLHIKTSVIPLYNTCLIKVIVPIFLQDLFYHLFYKNVIPALLSFF